MYSGMTLHERASVFMDKLKRECGAKFASSNHEAKAHHFTLSEYRGQHVEGRMYEAKRRTGKASLEMTKTATKISVWSTDWNKARLASDPHSILIREIPHGTPIVVHWNGQEWMPAEDSTWEVSAETARDCYEWMEIPK